MCWEERKYENQSDARLSAFREDLLPKELLVCCVWEKRRTFYLCLVLSVCLHRMSALFSSRGTHKEKGQKSYLTHFVLWQVAFWMSWSMLFYCQTQTNTSQSWCFFKTSAAVYSGLMESCTCHRRGRWGPPTPISPPPGPPLTPDPPPGPETHPDPVPSRDGEMALGLYGDEANCICLRFSSLLLLMSFLVSVPVSQWKLYQCLHLWIAFLQVESVVSERDDAYSLSTNTAVPDWWNLTLKSSCWLFTEWYRGPVPDEKWESVPCMKGP